MYKGLLFRVKVQSSQSRVVKRETVGGQNFGMWLIAAEKPDSSFASHPRPSATPPLGIVCSGMIKC